MRKRFVVLCRAFAVVLAVLFGMPGAAFGAQKPILNGPQLVWAVNAELREMGLPELNLDQLKVILANQSHALQLNGGLRPGLEIFLKNLIEEKAFEVSVEVHVSTGSGPMTKAATPVFSKDLPAHTILEVAVLDPLRAEASKKKMKSAWESLLVATALESVESGLPHYIRHSQIDVFGELEFAPNGRALRYEFNAEDYFAAASPKKEHQKVYAFLEVEALNWLRKGDRIYIGKGVPEYPVGQVDPETHEMTVRNSENEVVNELKFFEAFDQYCKDPAPGQKAPPVSESGEAPPAPPYRYLRHEHEHRFIEYDFRPDGKLFAYYGEETVPKKYEFLSEKSGIGFKVELLRWRSVDINTVAVKRGDEEELLKKGDYGAITSKSESWSWEKVEKLEFLARLKAFREKFCGDAK